MSKVFSAAEAARETGTSRTTIQRMLSRGQFSQAVKTETGWRIPLDDLLAAGLTPGLYKPDPEPVQDHDPDTATLAHQLEVMAVRLQAAQMLADERGRTIEQMQVTMRALEAGRRQEPTQRPSGLISRQFQRFGL